MSPSRSTYVASPVWDLPQAKYSGDFGLWIEPPGRERLYHRAMPDFIEDPDGADLFPHGLARIPVRYRPNYLAGLGQATLVGYRTLLLGNGTFVNDEECLTTEAYAAYLDRLAQRDAFLNEETGLIRVPGTKHFSLDRTSRPIVEFPGKTLVLCSTEPSNWGSFLFRILPKIVALSSLPPETKVIVCCTSPSMHQLITFAGIDPDRIIHHDPHAAYNIEDAFLPSMRNSNALLDEASLALFAKLRAAACDGGTSLYGGRLYVSRQFGQSSRCMLNEIELIDALQKLGFAIVSPEKLDVVEQIRIFAGADLVVGPSGAGMFNTVFCRPGTKIIDIESQPDWIHAHACLFGSCGHRFGIFVAKSVSTSPPPHQPFTVNIEALVRQIKQVLP